MSLFRSTIPFVLITSICPQQGILYAVLITFKHSCGVLAQKERLPVVLDIF